MSQTSSIAVERPRMRSKVRFLLIAARTVLGLIFVYAAYAKLHFNGAWHLRDYYFFFAMSIDSYRMLPLIMVLAHCWSLGPAYGGRASSSVRYSSCS
ncbi:MAG: hypothetical protein DMG30_12070 [Acidobacteria bacterium]|nr:MAG: hypothetical protein DMG30_12070 [Acidobacteriota bacterium]